MNDVFNFYLIKCFCPVDRPTKEITEPTKLRPAEVLDLET